MNTTRTITQKEVFLRVRYKLMQLGTRISMRDDGTIVGNGFALNGSLEGYARRMNIVRSDEVVEGVG